MADSRADGVTDAVGTVLAKVARQLLHRQDLDRLQTDSAQQIIAAEPAYLRAGVVFKEINRATRETLTLSLSRISGEPAPDTAASAPREIGRLRAEQAVPLSAVQHAFRLDFRVLWNAIVEKARDTQSSNHLALVDGWTAVWNEVERITKEAARSYRERERELREGRSDVRAVAFQELIEWGPHDQLLCARSSRTLGLPERGRFVVISGSLAAPSAAALEQVRSRLARRDLAAYIGGPLENIRGVVDASAIADGELRSLLTPLAEGRFGVAGIAGGIGEVGRGLRLARVADRTRQADALGIVYLADHWLNAALRSGAEVSDALASDVLGRLLALPREPREQLLETLSAYIECDGSINDVAARTYLHRNTVRKRLSRVEELTGRSLSAPSGVAQVVLALTWLNECIETVASTGNQRMSDSQA